MGLTLWCIVVVLGGVLGVGVPVTWLLNGRRPLTESDWIKVPFLGAATLVLVLQNLVYFDLPIGKTTPILWLALLLLWLWLYRSGQLGVTLARFPRLLFGVALLAYLVQGVGLLTIGPRDYVGRAWNDQFNYTAMAQFFMEEPFSFNLADMGHRPYLLNTLIKLRYHRIGQSMLQGFFAASAGTSAKPLFAPTILLCAPLLVLALYALARGLRLGRGVALPAAFVGSVLPAIALVQLESFLSQAVATPFLLYLPAALHELARRPGRRQLAALAVIFTGATSIYAEIWPILLGVLALSVLLTAIRHPQRWRLLGCGVIVATSTYFLNYLFTPYLLKIQTSLDQPVLQALYPTAFQIEGLAGLWLGDVLQGPPVTGAHGLARGFALVATVLGYAGLLAGFWRIYVTRRTARDWRTVVLAAGVLGLAALPMIVLARDDLHPYQYYKLLLTISPLLVLGLALLGQPLAVPGSLLRGTERTSAGPRSWLALLPLTAVAPLALLGTILMAHQSTTLGPTVRSHAAYYLRPGTRETQARLEALRNRDLLIATPYGGINQLRHAWLSYFARHNRIWLADPQVNATRLELHGNPGGIAVEAGTCIPDGFLLLTAPGSFRPGPQGDAQLLWANTEYELWQPGPGPWVIALREQHRNGPPDVVDGRLVYCVDAGKTTLEVLASSPGTLTLTGRLRNRLPQSSESGSRLRVETSAGHVAEPVLRGDCARLTVPVVAGKNVITLSTLDPPVPPAPPGSPEAMGMPAEVPGMQLEFTPGTWPE
jgi:hypothetical protein